MKADVKSQKPSEVSAGLNKENLQAAAQTTSTEVKLTENISITKSGDDVKGAKPVITLSEKKPAAKEIADRVANGC